MCPGGAIGAQEITGDNAREDRQADKKKKIPGGLAFYAV